MVMPADGILNNLEKYKQAGWKSVIEYSRQHYTLIDQETFNSAMDRLVGMTAIVRTGEVSTVNTMKNFILQIASDIGVSLEPNLLNTLSAELLAQIYDINETETPTEKLKKSVILAKHIEDTVIHGRNILVNDKQAELAVLLTNFALLATNLDADDTLNLLKKNRELGAYKRIGLENMRALSRSVITGSIDVSAADSVIPPSVQEKLARHGFKTTEVPPLCLESYQLLELTEKEIGELKMNEKMACLNVSNLITKTKAEIVKIIEDNYDEAMNLAFKTADEDLIKGPDDVKSLLENISNIMGKGVVEGSWLRRHDSEKFKVYTRVKDLSSQLDYFSTEFFQRLKDIKGIKDYELRKKATIEMAAWCEYRINLTDHFLADGCGKTSTLLANYVFMAAKIPPTEMPTMDRKSYFNFDVVPSTNLVVKIKRRDDHIAHAIPEQKTRIFKEWERWLRHYQNAFFPKDYQTITCDNAWTVPSLTLGQHLQTLGITGEENKYVIPEDANFTNLHHSLRGEYEVAELASAIGDQDIQKLITYPLSRLCLFHSIVYAETELKTESDEDLVHISHDIHHTLKEVKIDDIKFNSWLDQKQKEFILDARGHAERASHGDGIYAGKYKELLETIRRRYQSGEYVLGNNLPLITKPIPPEDIGLSALALAERYGANNLAPDAEHPKEIILKDPDQAIQEIAKKLISDIAYQEISKLFIETNVEPMISAIVDARQLNRLDIPAPKDRHTFMMAGAPACGKGTAVATVARLAEDNLGITWDNTVKVNTDTHRLIISHPIITGERKEFSGTLNNHEAGILTDMAYSRLQKKAALGIAPHMLIDGVNMSKERMELGIMNSGKLQLAVVTVPPELSVERAFERGKQDGRFVPTSYNLSKHRQISKNFFKELETCLGKNAEVILFDTEVPRRAPPKKIMRTDLETKEVVIYNKDKFAKFLGRAKLDITATSAEEIYMHEKDKLDESYHEKLTQMGFTIRYESEEDENTRIARFEEQKKLLQKEVHDALSIMETTTKDSPTAKKVYQSLNEIQERFFHNLTSSLKPKALEDLISGFRKECAKHTKQADKIMGHGWLYRIVEATIKAVIGIFAGIGMVLGAAFKQGLAKKEHITQYKDKFFTWDKTDASKKIDDVKRTLLGDDDKDQGLLDGTDIKKNL